MTQSENEPTGIDTAAALTPPHAEADAPAGAASTAEATPPAPVGGNQAQGLEDEDDPAAQIGDEAEEDRPAPGQPGAKRAALENEGEIAADYLEELLDIADLDGDIDTFVEAGRPRVSILTDGDLLVGRNGEVLEALQELARLAVMTETGKRSRLMLDVAGHRDKRRRELENLAQDAVTEVRQTSEAVRLAPMNPFERKIVHDVVAAAGLVSESEGQEPQRRVVVLPA